MADDEILYRPYTTERDLPEIMALVQSELSEPYVIYTYRYFLNQWPHLSFIAFTSKSPKPVGVIVSKQDIHKGSVSRGYIAMLSVAREFRKRGIGSHLVRLSVEAMQRGAAHEVTLETEHDNRAALSLYASLGFMRDKRLYRFYMSGKDAFRLVLPLISPSSIPEPSPQSAVPAGRESDSYSSGIPVTF